MDQLKWPPFLLACLAAVLIVSLELGANWVTSAPAPQALGGGSTELSPAEVRIQRELQANGLSKSALPKKAQDKLPPGLALPRMAVLDALVLFSMGLMAAPLIWTARVHGRVQGIVTLVVSILLLLTGIKLALMTWAQLVLMVNLLLSPPFGLIAYLVKWGFFETGRATSVLSLLLFLKLVLVVGLVLAHPRFLKMKGLLLLLGCSLLSVLLVKILHAFVPLPIVSITDAIGALVILIIALIWTLFFLIGSIPAVFKAIF